MENILESPFIKTKVDFQKTATEQKKQVFALSMIENHQKNALVEHLKNKGLLFAAGEPFYTELKEEGMYKKELPNGGTHIVRCHFAADGTIIDEIIKDYHV